MFTPHFLIKDEYLQFASVEVVFPSISAVSRWLTLFSFLENQLNCLVNGNLKYEYYLLGSHVFYFCFLAAFLWQLMRFNMLQLVKKLRSRFQGREMSDADILNWANRKIRFSSRKSRIESFKVGDQLLCLLSIMFVICGYLLMGCCRNLLPGWLLMDCRILM